MAGLAAQSLTAGGLVVAVFAFGVAGAVLVLLMFGAALGVAVAQERVVGRLEAGAPTVKKWGGRVLVVVGLWFVVLAAFADPIADLIR